MNDIVQQTSILGDIKLSFLSTKVQEIKDENVPGWTAEIGVFLGGTSRLIHQMLPEKIHICYDTFEGIQGAQPGIDVHSDGEFKCNLMSVQRNIDLHENIVYKKGFFPDTFAEQHVKFAFVHSDTDTYHGTKTTLESFAPQMSPGGIILFDDYQWAACPGVEKALDEFRLHDTHFDHFPCGHHGQYVLKRKPII